MTRFARAKGSKSSNLKAPDESTPWEVMKEQMSQAKKESEDNKNRHLAESQRLENYNNFLKEQKVQKRKATWCEFPEADSSKKAKLQSSPVEKNSIKNKCKLKKRSVDQTKDIEEGNEISDIGSDTHKKKKKKCKQEETTPETDETVKESNVNIEDIEHKKDKANKKKKNKQAVEITKNTVPDNQPYEQLNNGQKKKNKKRKSGKAIRRKEINDNSFQLIINGKEVELMRFDGFPIMKKDAQRLTELKTNMMKKGIPKTEVNRTIKLERRRAEKALARLKRDVCYNCRKGGHNLSDCPELKSNIPGVGAAEGVCFKCGSTEHRQFECKVQRDKEFRFASCFICKEQGHIARQCPDNPKGLYPNGGGCKLCGDVTHLRKDCPTTQSKSEGTSIKLQTLDAGSNVEDIDLQTKAVSEDATRKPKKIKF